MLQWSYFEDVEQDVQTYKSDLVVPPDTAFAILWLKRGRELVLKTVKLKKKSSVKDVKTVEDED